ncbi:PGPGW domain-containing protein [Nocardioides sp.]|uniref:PGPGW domain-containing protein n=1 Tax=Nocardioides sp. TaxID=35761 RepID=UPI00261C0405|nr:PGPGW domain-containing protein [Nocardioides sp.]MDI6911546.1 PGPGW domain-containing protein [Nocardioides sp.]
MKAVVRRVAVEVLGWVLVVAGVAALVLPGPGLLMIFAGLVVLSQEYEWAERRLEPVKIRALRGAAEGVENRRRIAFSTTIAVGLIGCGALWIWGPAAPGWWPLGEQWWLPGGAATGVTQVASGLIAIGLIVYSYRRFRIRGEPVPELSDRRDDEADRDDEAGTADRDAGN